METSWSRCGAVVAVAAAAASDAACVGVPAALGRSWTAPGPLLDRSRLKTTFRLLKPLEPIAKEKL